MVKNMPTAEDNPMAQQQKILLYVFPLMFAVFGINFPIGVLIYWMTTNLWTMGQQFYVIRRNPAPGTPAYDAWRSARPQKAAHKAAIEETAATPRGCGLEPTAAARAARAAQAQDRSQRRSPSDGKGRPRPSPPRPGKIRTPSERSPRRRCRPSST